MYELQKLAMSVGDHQNVELVVRSLTTDVLTSLDADLVTVWLLDDDLSAMTCISSKDREDSRDLKDMVLSRADFPTYFQSIFENQTVSARNVMENQVLAELVDSYFQPNGVKSLLDYVIFDGPTPRAIICCETTEDYREWQEADTNEIRKLTVFSSSLIEWH